jgi:transcriptional regulator with XRE-family HTH domain
VRKANDSDFGKRLKEAYGVSTNKELAEKIGEKETTVGTYVRGRIPKLDLLIKISKRTNRTLDWLLTGEGRQYLNEPKSGILRNPDSEKDLREELTRLTERFNELESVVYSLLDNIKGLEKSDNQAEREPVEWHSLMLEINEKTNLNISQKTLVAFLVNKTEEIPRYIVNLLKAGAEGRLDKYLKKNPVEQYLKNEAAH